MMSSTASANIRWSGSPERRIAALIGLEAASLAVMSALHLTATLAGGPKPFESSHAGIAEALICLVLLSSVTALLRGFRHARTIALGALTFAILGFLVGLNFTVRSGHPIDVAYHATVLPLLLLTLLLVRERTGRAG